MYLRPPYKGLTRRPTSRRWEPRLELVCLIDREWEAEDDGPPANPVLRLTVLDANCGWGRDLDRVLAHDLAHAATARHVPAGNTTAVTQRHKGGGGESGGDLVHTPRL